MGMEVRHEVQGDLSSLGAQKGRERAEVIEDREGSGSLG